MWGGEPKENGDDKWITIAKAAGEEYMRECLRRQRKIEIYKQTSGRSNHFKIDKRVIAKHVEEEYS